MKNLLLSLSCASVFFAPNLFAQNTEDTAVKFRINEQRGENDAGVDFLSALVWTQYDTGLSGDDQWADATDLTNAPWERTQAASNRMQLKMDGSIANVNSAFGSASNIMNVNVTGLYMSTLNINADFYIAENIWQDGASTVNINGTATVSLDSGSGNGQISVDTVNINGTSSTERATYIGKFNMNGGDVRTVNISNANVSTAGNLNMDLGNSNINRTITIGDNVSYEFTSGGLRLGGGDATGGTTMFEIAGNNNVFTIANSIEFNDDRRAGGSNNFKISGDNNTVDIASNGIRMGNKDTSGGEANFIVNGNNNTVTANGGIEWGDQGHSGGDAVLTIGGSGNTVTSVGNTNIDGWSGGDGSNVYSGGSSGIVIGGSGNTYASSNRIALGLGGDGKGQFSGGKNFIHVKSDSDVAGEESVIKANSILLGLGNTAGTTYESEIVFGGNTRLEKYDTGADFNISLGSRGWSSSDVMYQGGTSTMKIENSNNVLNFTNLYVGSSNEVQGGESYVIMGGTNNSIYLDGNMWLGNSDDSTLSKGEFVYGGSNNSFSVGTVYMASGSTTHAGAKVGAILRIVGSDNGNITIRNNLNTWATTSDFDTAYDNGNMSTGAWFVFEFDDYGVNGIESDASDLGGAFILLDFTKVDSRLIEPEFLNVMLISSGDLDVSRIKALLLDGTLAESGEEGAYGDYFEVVQNTNGIYINYYGALVPEPSIYAAILGALALGTAVYRRKRN